jgi:hypothetical protein
MEEKEKSENTKRKFSIQITEDGKQMLLLDDRIDNLVSRTSFYEDFDLTNQEKKELGHAMVAKLFTILGNRDAKSNEESWVYKCGGFRDAYAIESRNKTASKTTVTWLMTTILGISQEEADRRYDTAEELMSHPDFKNKEHVVVDKIYLSKNNINSL